MRSRSYFDRRLWPDRAGDRGHQRPLRLTVVADVEVCRFVGIPARLATGHRRHPVGKGFADHSTNSFRRRTTTAADPRRAWRRAERRGNLGYSSPCSTRRQNTSRCKRRGQGGDADPDPLRCLVGGESATSTTSWSSIATSIRPRRCRKPSLTRFPVIRRSHPRKGPSPRQVSRPRNARMKVSWTRSSTSALEAPPAATYRPSAGACRLTR